MKNKKRFIIILLTVVFMTSGCTKYLTSDDNKRVTNEVTGQPVTSNILCLPENKDLLKIYEDNKNDLEVNYKSLKKCSEFKPSNLKYKSLWESVFIKPLAWLIIKLGLLVNNYGLSVILMGILIRLVLMPFTFKSIKQSENMRKAQPELNKIQQKYAGEGNQLNSMMMTQEMMAVYQKYNIKPASGCLISFIQLPILLAFLEAINRVPAIFEGKFLTLELGKTPLIGISSGDLLYLVLILLIILSTYYSYKITMSATSGNEMQDAQMKMMMRMMIVFIAFASMSLPTALALYWITSNCFMLIQNIFIKKNSGKDSNIKYAKVRVKKGA